MERLNGEVQDRENNAGSEKSKTQRFCRATKFITIILGHMALNRKTPAEKCGIIIEGQDK